MKRFKKKEIIALAVIAVLIIAVIIAGIVIITGTSNEENKNNTTGTTAETQVVTEISTDAEGNTTVVEVTQAEEKTTEAEADDNSNSQVTDETVKKKSESYDDSTVKNNTTSATTADNNSDNSNSDDDKDTDYDNNISGDSGEVDVVTPETKPVDKNEDILTINGTKCNVGNTITITLDAKTPVVLENYQGFTTYDNTYLEFVSVKGNVSGMFNNHESAIYYNGSDIGAGYDFTNKGTLYTATFKVLKAGSTKISNTIEVMSDTNSKPVDQTKCEYSIGIFN